MATINKRPSGGWQATVRRDGKSRSKTFTKRADALKWARETEIQAERTGIVRQSRSVDTYPVQKTTLADALHRLADEKSGERWRLHALARARVAKSRIKTLSVADVAQWRDRRLRVAKPSTVVRELSLMQTAIDRVLGENADTTANPVRQVKRPRIEDRRERRLDDDEWQRLLQAADACQNKLMHPLLVLARETAMRRGELLAMQWKHVDLDACTVLLPKTKNGHARLVPLSPTAIDVLRNLPHDDNRVLPISENAVRLAWQ